MHLDDRVAMIAPDYPDVYRCATQHYYGHQTNGDGHCLVWPCDVDECLRAGFVYVSPPVVEEVAAQPARARAVYSPNVEVPVG